MLFISSRAARSPPFLRAGNDPRWLEQARSTASSGRLPRAPGHEQVERLNGFRIHDHVGVMPRPPLEMANVVIPVSSLIFEPVTPLSTVTRPPVLNFSGAVNWIVTMSAL